jgi:hypothetical protein
LTKASAGKIDKYQPEANKIKTKLLISALKSNERKKIESPNHGKWLSLCNEDLIIFTVCVPSNYSERLGNQFLDVRFQNFYTGVDGGKFYFNSF